MGEEQEQRELCNAARPKLIWTSLEQHQARARWARLASSDLEKRVLDLRSPPQEFERHALTKQPLRVQESLVTAAPGDPIEAIDLALLGVMRQAEGAERGLQTLHERAERRRDVFREDLELLTPASQRSAGNTHCRASSRPRTRDSESGSARLTLTTRGGSRVTAQGGHSSEQWRATAC